MSQADQLIQEINEALREHYGLTEAEWEQVREQLDQFKPVQ